MTAMTIFSSICSRLTDILPGLHAIDCTALPAEFLLQTDKTAAEAVKLRGIRPVYYPFQFFVFSLFCHGRYFPLSSFSLILSRGGTGVILSSFVCFPCFRFAPCGALI